MQIPFFMPAYVTVHTEPPPACAPVALTRSRDGVNSNQFTTNLQQFMEKN